MQGWHLHQADLFHELGVDVDDIYDNLIHEVVVDEQGKETTALRDEYKDMDDEDLFKEFPDVTRAAVHEALDHAEDRGLDMNWADNLFYYHATRNAKKNMIRPPFATLYFAPHEAERGP